MNTKGTRGRFSRTLAVAVAACACVALAAGAGCSTGQQMQQPAGAPSATASSTADASAAASDGVMHLADWQEAYPHQCESFLAQAHKPNQYNERTASSTRNHMASEAAFQEFFGDEGFTAVCLQCHATGFQEIYDDLGDAVETTSWSAVKDQYPDAEFWGCYLCHENDPENTLKATNYYYTGVMGDADFKPGVAVCAQCHVTCADTYGPLDDVEGGVKMFTYGTDLESVYKAMLDNYEALGDDFAFLFKDPETGIMMFDGGSPQDAEVFTGSNHDSLGLTCVDCHMPTETASDGTTFTNHDASRSPLDSEAALEYCLTCHTAQGVSSPEAMVDFVVERKDALMESYAAVAQKQEQLYDLIVTGVEAGNVAESDLGQARYNYSLSIWLTMDIMSNGGYTVAHNYDGLKDYCARAGQLADEGIALLS